MNDILRDMGPVFLGSRLKRLGERMQAGAARVIADAGLDVQPAHMPLLAALDGGATTIGRLAVSVGVSQPGVTRSVGQLVELGLVGISAGVDARHRQIALTGEGEAAVARAKLRVWPQISDAVDRLLRGDTAELLATISGIEDALSKMPLDELAKDAAPAGLAIRDYADDLAGAFHDINAEWIAAMFRLEQTDLEVLEHPRERIVDPGGAILFVEAPGLGIVGTCALQRTGGRAVELTKMGVRPPARGLKAGEFLLRAAIARAEGMGADPLYLLTSAKCEAAIHLYKKLGFRHDTGIMATYGARYARCDVAMRYADATA